MNRVRNIMYSPTLIYSRLEDDGVHSYHSMDFYKKLKETGNDAYLLMGNGAIWERILRI
jgi:prolyl oligopeptidase PreP (S9A serine peptidase family)